MTGLQRAGGRRWRIVAASGAAALVAATVAVAGAGGAKGSVQRAGAAHTADAGRLVTPSGGVAPQILRRAYGVSSLLREGIDGRGETVVLPVVGFPPGTKGLSNIRQSLAAFDRRYRLPGADLSVGRLFGYAGNPALAQLEEVLDVETVHTFAPAARIKVLLAGAHAFKPAQLGALLHAAAGRGNIVSLSFAECERCLTARALRSVRSALEYARDRHVTVLAATGDFGAASGGTVNGPSATRGVEAPASSPLVTAVGGTTLAVHPDGAYGSETAWNENALHNLPKAEARYVATGGGVSARYARPAYQAGLPGIGDHRGIPDVAAPGEPGLRLVLNGGTTPMARHARPADAPGGFFSIPGGETSQAAPTWAGIVALADQDAHRQLGFINEGLYRIGHSALYHRAFHDITRGDNTVTLPSGKRIVGYHARPGWDPVTGWGSPDAQVLVPLLGREVRRGDGRGL